MNKKYTVIIFTFATMILISCESEHAREIRLAKEEKQRIELEEKRLVEEANRLAQLEKERLEREVQLEQERIEREIYNKYIDNSLSTGATPYSRNYGGNSKCKSFGCSEIRVKTPYNSDVLVTIKKDSKVVRHAFIKAGNSYTFEVPDGTYQPFFYYGKGWNPEKEMKDGEILGGFISDESFGKDESQYLNNNILEYELILQKNGNFSTRPSNQNEAL